MKTASFATLAKRSIQDTHQYLFRPFSVRKWIALVSIAFFAGVLTSGINFSLREQIKNSASATAGRSGILRFAQAKGVPMQSLQSPKSLPGLFPAKPFNFSNTETYVFDWLRSLWNSWFGKIVFGFLLLIFIIGPWFVARFSFVWFHDVMRREVAVEEPFHQFKRQGNSLFRAALTANLIFAVLIVAAALLIIYSAFYTNMFHAQENISPAFLLKSLEVPLLILTILIISISFFYWVARDFVVPVMAADQVNFKKGWKSFVAVYGQNRSEFWKYFLVTSFLRMITGIAEMFIAAVWILALVLGGAVLFLIPFLIFNVLVMQLEFVFWCYAVLVGIPFLLFAMLTSLAVHLPFAVFYRLFSLYFLSSLQSPYRLLAMDQYEI